ncbi:MAG: ATP-binding protein [Thermoplasmata archaeon]|nr:ATP-binding protein [Thermoplasmata archaeon]
MISMEFIDRIEEMELLNTLWSEDKALVVIYGKRRVGKTRLIQEFTSSMDTFFFTFSDTSVGVQLREFRSRAAEYLRDTMITKLKGDWYDTLRFFFRNLKDSTTVVLDEFTYAIKADRKILSDLQRLWDGEPGDRKIKLIICGSMLGMVKEEILAHTSPLYGRRTRDIHLGDLRYQDALDFFSEPEYGITAYMMVGGMPEYLLVASKHKNLRDFVTNELLDRKGYFYREPYYLLSQNLKDMKTYFAILNAIAYGNTKPSKIANFVDVPGRSIYPYLENLQRLEFIRREIPVGGNPKRGIYTLSEPMLYSWFNIVYRKRHETEIGAASFVPEDMNRILGTAFESLSIEYMVEMNKKYTMGLNRIGRWWHKGEEIDIVCLKTKSKEVWLFEIKYKKLNLNTCKRILNKLEKKSELTPWFADKWNIRYGIIARDIKDKASLNNDGYLCYDMGDIISLTRR